MTAIFHTKAKNKPITTIFTTATTKVEALYESRSTSILNDIFDKSPLCVMARWYAHIRVHIGLHANKLLMGCALAFQVYQCIYTYIGMPCRKI